jgi:hypothetical protein
VGVEPILTKATGSKNKEIHFCLKIPHHKSDLHDFRNPKEVTNILKQINK